jgi:AcrR family transcriptional regulator
MPRGEFDRTPRSARTRRALLDAAATVYARDGLRGATLDDVAAEAGFTKGAVYGQFGSKENLLIALFEEHVAEEVALQLGLFDREQTTWRRPIAGSDSWMRDVQENPAFFRLFVEMWGEAQRDEALRARVTAAFAALRATFAHFAAASSEDAGVAAPSGVPEQFANVTFGLGVGLAMLSLMDPDSVAPDLLGTTLSVLVRALEEDDQARDAFAALIDRPPSE